MAGTMNWTYQAFSEFEPGPIMDHIQNCLNGLPASAVAIAKAVQSNHHGGNAHGAVFYPENPVDTPLPFPAAKEVIWDTYFVTGNNYQWVVDKLNTLTDVQAAYAHVGFSDTHDGDAVLTVFQMRE